MADNSFTSLVSHGFVPIVDPVKNSIVLYSSDDFALRDVAGNLLVVIEED